jgi:hypothetical protein
VLLSGTDKSHFYQLFPNGIDRQNRIAAHQELILPRKGWHITAGGPPGVNHLLVMVAKSPRDFSVFVQRKPRGDIPEFDLAQAQWLWQGRSARQSSLFAGQLRCPNGGMECDPAYGAALLEIEELK